MPTPDGAVTEDERAQSPTPSRALGPRPPRQPVRYASSKSSTIRLSLNNNDPPRERAIIAFLVALSLLSYARLYMLRDVYADDNCWLLAMYISDNLHDFLATGFIELRRVPQGLFVYLHLLPYRLLEDPYVIWHTLSLGVQIITPLVLYRFVRNLCGDVWLAVFVATVFIVVPLQHVLPYVNTLNYRLGALLAIGSLYLTDTAARDGRWGWRIPLALISAGFAEHMLTEAAIGLEPARVLVIWNRFYRAGRPLREPIVRAIKWLMPFALVGAALVAYKLIFRPYGIYAGMYSTAFSHFFDRESISELIRLFAFGLWRLLKNVRSYAHTVTTALGVLAGGVALYFLLKLRSSGDDRQPSSMRPHVVAVVFGIAMLVPVLFIFFYAGRHPKLGTDSAHATLMQPGYALILGATAHWVALRARALGQPGFVVVAVGLAALTGMGVYFSNLNLDLFRFASFRQEQFLSAFMKRFPVPPERADFVIDASPPRYSPNLETFFQFEDIHASYELELGLNRLYAPGALTGTRRYRVYPLEELMHDYRSKGAKMFGNKLVRWTHYGNDTLDFAEMTYVYWRGGEVLVNQEILKASPGAIYRELANKPPPAWAR